MMSSGREGRSGEFTFSCPELLHNGKFNVRAKEYIHSAGNSVNVRNLFTSYSDKVETLYGWLASVIENHLPPAVVDYRRCVQARKRNAARCSWRIILQQVAIPRGLDPYQYLDHYLNEDQLAEVMSFPHRSVEQVDRIVELADKHGACNEELRGLVYRLFQVEN